MSDWSTWTITQWNEALLAYFFEDVHACRSPVGYLDVSSESLSKAVGAKQAEAPRVRDAFVSTVSGLPGRALGSFVKDAQRLRVGWSPKSQRVPPFLSHLLFSCMVASEVTDARTCNITHFRDRLQTLIHRADGLHGDAFPLMWQELVHFLDHARASGRPFRCLALPDPKHETIIGYSKRLAFPPRQDALRLLDCLNAEDLLGFEPGPSAIVRCLASRRGTFTSVLQDAFDEFRALVLTRDRALFNCRLFGAISDICLRGHFIESEGRSVPVGRLLMEDSDGFEMFLLFDAPLQSKRDGVRTERTPYGEGDFEHLMLGLEEDASYPVDCLLSDRERCFLFEWGLGYLRPYLRRGVLLFQQTETGLFAFTNQVPAWGKVRMLVHIDRWHALKQHLQVLGGHFRGERARGNWRWVCTDPSSLLDALTHPSCPNWFRKGYERIERCLQIDLIGGARHEGGWIGLAGCLPTVRCEGASSIVLEEEIAEGRTFDLQRDEEDASMWRMPHLRLEGLFCLLARDGSTALAQRRLLLIGGLDRQDYLRPADAARWSVEGGYPESDEAHPGTLTGPEAEGSHLSIRSKRQAEDRSAGPQDVDQRADHAAKIAAHRLEIWLGARSLRRQGLSVAEVLDAVRRQFGVRRYDLVWDIVRSWQERGFIDRLDSKRFPQARYFAVRPHFVLYPTAEKKICAVLFGLSNVHLRLRIMRWAIYERIGFWLRPPADDYAPAQLVLEADRSSQLEDIVDEESLAAPTWLNAPSALLGTVPRHRMEPLPYLESNYWDELLHQAFLFEQGRFVDAEPQLKKEGVEVRRLRALRMPEYYAVFVDQTPLWWGASRNWALLCGYRYLDAKPLGFDEAGALVRRGSSGVFLPVLLARYLTVVGGGPSVWTQGARSYRYVCEDRRLFGTLWMRLWGLSSGRSAQRRLEIAPALLGDAGPRVYVPPAMLHLVERVFGKHVASMLSRRAISVRAMAHLVAELKAAVQLGGGA